MLWLLSLNYFHFFYFLAMYPLSHVDTAKISPIVRADFILLFPCFLWNATQSFVHSRTGGSFRKPWPVPGLAVLSHRLRASGLKLSDTPHVSHFHLRFAQRLSNIGS